MPGNGGWVIYINSLQISLCIIDYVLLVLSLLLMSCDERACNMVFIKSNVIPYIRSITTDRTDGNTNNLSGKGMVWSRGGYYSCSSFVVFVFIIVYTPVCWDIAPSLIR